MALTLRHFDGFDSISLGVGTGLPGNLYPNGQGTFANSTVKVHRGGSTQSAFNGGDGGRLGYPITASNPALTVGWINWDAVPSTDTFVLSLEATNNAAIAIKNGRWVLDQWNGSSHTTIQTGPAVAANTDYWLELYIDATANPWIVRWWINNVEQTAGSFALGATSFTTTFFGELVANTPCYLDDWATWQVTSVADRPGEVTALTVGPSGAAEHQAITLTQWQTTPDFSAFTNFVSQTESVSAPLLASFDTVDGIQMNGGASGQAGAARWSFANPPASSATVALGVRGLLTGRESAAGVNNLTVRVLLNGSTTDIFNGDPGWGTTFNYVVALLSRPGGGSWSSQDIIDLKAEIVSTDTTPAIWIGGINVESLWQTVLPLTVLQQLQPVARGSWGW